MFIIIALRSQKTMQLFFSDWSAVRLFSRSDVDRCHRQNRVGSSTTLSWFQRSMNRISLTLLFFCPPVNNLSVIPVLLLTVHEGQLYKVNLSVLII